MHDQAQLKQIPIANIVPNPEQPRTLFDQTKLEELAASIQESGLEHPVTVEDLGEGRFQLIDGERRWRAHQLSEMAEISAIVHPYRGEDPGARLTRLVSAVVSNEQADELSHVERARAYRRALDLAEEAGEKLSRAGLARKLGKSTGHVAGALQLLEFHGDLQEMVHRGEFSADPRVVKSMIKLPPEIQLELAKRLLSRRASVKAMVAAAERMATTLGLQPKIGRTKNYQPDAKIAAFKHTPTPALFLALDDVVGLPKGEGTLPEGSLKRIALKLCSECDSLPAGVTAPPSWMMLQRGARQTCKACAFGTPDNRNLKICENCPAVNVLKIALGAMELEHEHS
jgi:ParB family chromosome partitioning protein